MPRIVSAKLLLMKIPHILTCALICTASLLAGCVPSRPFAAVPAGSPDLLRSGVHGVQVMRKGPPVWQVYSYFHIPYGNEEARFSGPMPCPDRRIGLKLGRDTPHPESLMASICDVASSAMEYLDPTGAFAIRIHVVPEGKTAWRRTIHLGRRPRLSLAVPLLDDQAHTLSLTARIIGHEGSHLLDHILDAPDPISYVGEQRAHRRGLCAQLVALGQVTASDLPTAAYNAESEAFERSTSAARAVIREALPDLEGGAARMGSPEADAILARCAQVETTRAKGHP